MSGGADISEDGRVYCRGCRYSLRGLAAGKCPECGEEFDPEKPETYLVSRVSIAAKFVFRLQWAASTAPLLPLVLVHFEYMVGRVALGHWPRSSIDDPMGIAFGNFVHVFTFISVPLALLCAALLMGLVMWIVSTGRLLVAASLLLVNALSWAVLIGYCRLDPHRILYWWFD